MEMKINNPQIRRRLKKFFICANRSAKLTTKSAKSADKKYFQMKSDQINPQKGQYNNNSHDAKKISLFE